MRWVQWRGKEWKWTWHLDATRLLNVSVFQPDPWLPGNKPGGCCPVQPEGIDHVQSRERSKIYHLEITSIKTKGRERPIIANRIIKPIYRSKLINHLIESMWTTWCTVSIATKRKDELCFFCQTCNSLR